MNQGSPEVFINWICGAYALLREREDVMLQEYLHLVGKESYHDGIKYAYDSLQEVGEYLHGEELNNVHTQVGLSRDEYFKARNQTNQMAHFMLSLLLINK